MTATNVRMLDFEQAVQATLLADVQISPDGRQVAYVTTPVSMAGKHPVREIWLVAAEGGTPRQLTASEAADSSPRWSPDGGRIAFVSDRLERGKPQIYVLDLSGGEAVRLTDAARGASQPAWSPDGSRLAFTMLDERPDEQGRDSDVIVVDSHIDRGGLWVLDVPADVATLDTLPEPRRISPTGVHVATPPSWAPDGSGFVVALSNSPLLQDIVRMDLAILSLDGEVRRLGEIEGLESIPQFSPDGSTIALSAAEGAIPASYCLLTIPAEGGDFTNLAPGYEGSFMAFAWLDDQRIVTSIQQRQQQVYQVVNVASGALDDAFQPFDEPGSSPPALSLSADGERVAFARATDLSFNEVYVAELGGTARKLTDLNPWTRDHDFGETRVVSWAAPDGLDIEGLLVLPVGYQEGRRYPLLVYIHGGPTAAWTHRLYAGWNDLAQFMAQRGYAVLLPNPRGSSGRGTAFSCAIVGCYGEPDSDDIMSGVDYLIAQGIADPEQLVVGGSSGGGFLTNYLITIHPEGSRRFKAAVTGAGISNWVSMLGTTDGRTYLDRYLGRIEEDPEVHWRLSPVRKIANATTPTLIRYGADDRRVPPSQGYELYQGLKDRGVETELVLYPREGHGDMSMRERAHQLDLMRRIVGWYERHLGRA